MTIEISLDKKRGRLPHLPLDYDHRLKLCRMPKIILDLQRIHCLFQPCVLHEYRRLAVQFSKRKKNGKDFCDCFHFYLDQVDQGNFLYVIVLGWLWGRERILSPPSELDSFIDRHFVKELHIVRFHCHCEWRIIASGKLAGKAQGLNGCLVHLHPIKVVFHLWSECDTACRVEAHIVLLFVRDMIGKLCPLAPWQASVFLWQGSVFASLLDEFLVVIVDAATHHDCCHLFHLGIHALACLEFLAKDGREV